FAINIATFAGFETHGFLGALVATIGVALPSFIIILLIASFSAKFLATKPAKAILSWINPLTIGLIFAAGLSVSASTIFGNYYDFNQISFNYIALMIFVIILVLSFTLKKINPVYLILLSGILGLVFYSIL